jgi:hypothetical protein
MKRTLIAVLALLGCGNADDLDGVVRRDESAVTVAHPPRVHQAPRDLPTVHQRAAAPESVGVTLSNLPESGHLFAVVGMLSCGFLEVGRADADVVNGSVSLTIPLQPQTTGEAWSIFFYVDDGDGQCTTEKVRSARLPALPASAVQIDVSQLQDSYGFAACWAFQ